MRFTRLIVVVPIISIIATAPIEIQRGASPLQVHFTDITSSAGIHFIHNNGAFGKKLLPETIGPGCAFIDYNRDGWQDILLVNGEDWPQHHKSATTLALYRNNHDGTFTDVTKTSGLNIPMYGIGVAIGDYDNDGFDDIFVTAVGRNHLFHNNGDGTFTDVTRKAGLATASHISTSAVWVDYDRDGYLDLFVTNYASWSLQNDLFCTLDGKQKSYCTAELYRGDSPRLYHNNKDGTFTDLTQEADVYKPTSKSLGVIAVDIDDDGWPDLVVTNDSEPNAFFHNNGNGTFSEAGETVGFGYAVTGLPGSSTGVDASDYDSSGRQSIVLATSSGLLLFHNEGKGLFYEGRNFLLDVSEKSGVTGASSMTKGFATFFWDFDLDGYPDIFVADGHIDAGIDLIQPRAGYAQPPHLLRNDGNGRFEDVTPKTGAFLGRRIVGRGACYGDIDNDGDLDLLVMTNGGPAYLYRNDGGNRNSWIGFKLEGRSSNRDGIGAKVRIFAGGRTQTQVVKSGSGYLSQNQLPLVFGLGSVSNVEKVEVFWPSGTHQVLGPYSARQTYKVVEAADLSHSQ